MVKKIMHDGFSYVEVNGKSLQENRWEQLTDRVCCRLSVCEEDIDLELSLVNAEKTERAELKVEFRSIIGSVLTRLDEIGELLAYIKMETCGPNMHSISYELYQNMASASTRCCDWNTGSRGESNLENENVEEYCKFLLGALLSDPISNNFGIAEVKDFLMAVIEEMAFRIVNTKHKNAPKLKKLIDKRKEKLLEQIAVYDNIVEQITPSIKALQLKN